MEREWKERGNGFVEKGLKGSSSSSSSPGSSDERSEELGVPELCSAISGAAIARFEDGRGEL